MSMNEILVHYESRGLKFKPFSMLDVPALTATHGSMRIVLEGTGGLSYAALTFPLDDICEAEINELSELVIPAWTGFMPKETASLSANYDGLHIHFVCVPKLGRCLFSIHADNISGELTPIIPERQTWTDSCGRRGARLKT